MSALVLKRKAGESIRIGQEITVTVLQMKGGGVSLRVEAPRDMTVNRSEIHDAKHRPCLRVFEPELQHA